MPTNTYTTANGTTYVATTGGATDSVVITDHGSTSATYNITGLPSANLIATTGGSANPALSILFPTNIVVLPGVTASSITVSASILATTNIYVGGTTSVNLVISAASTTNLYVDGGSATLAQGTLLGALSTTNVLISDAGTFSNGNAAITALDSINVSFGANGGTYNVSAGSNGLALLSGSSIGNYNPATDVIQFSNLVSHPVSYIITGSGTSRTVTLYSGTAGTGTALGTYTATLATGVTLTNGTYTVGAGPLAISSSGTTTDVGVCFLAGSMIETPGGEVAVEDLQINDQVVAYVDGKAETRAIIWAGRRHFTVNPDLSDDLAGYPVRIRKDAIADGVPSMDLLVTPEHCLFLDGKFVPARMQVNGTSIIYDRTITAYDY